MKKKKLANYKRGGKNPYATKKYNLGGINSLMQLGNAGGQFVEQNWGNNEDGSQNVPAMGMAGNMKFGMLGAAMGIYKAVKHNKAFAKAEEERLRKEKEMEKTALDEYSRGVLATYPTEGVDTHSYWAKKGGKIPVKPGAMAMPGGSEKPLANGVSKFEGRTHEEGGIKGQGYEVEDKEVAIDLDKDGANEAVVSDDLGFAKEAERLGKKKGEIENKILDVQGTDSVAQSTRDRYQSMIDDIDKQLEMVFAEQEAYKVANGIQNETEMKKGGKRYAKLSPGSYDRFAYRSELMPKEPGIFDQLKGIDFNEASRGIGDAGYAVAPFIDNIANAKLTNQTPKIPVPRMARAIPLKTKYNIEPALSDIKESERVAGRYMAENNVGSGIANANRAGIMARGLDAKSRLHAHKENVETQLANHSRMNTQGVTNQNIQTMNNYDWMKTMRENDMRLERSANVSNMADDLTASQIDRNARALDLEKVIINAKTSGDTGVLASLMGTSTMDQAIKGDKEFAKWFYGTLSNRPVDKAKFEQLYGKP